MPGRVRGEPGSGAGGTHVSIHLAAVLDGIVRRHGESVLADRARLHALLRDYADGDLRSVRLVMTAYDSGAALRFQAEPGVVSPSELEGETARLVDLFGTRPDLARAAVETWAAFVARSRAGVVATSVRPLPLPGAPVPLRALPLASTPTAATWRAGLVRWALVVAGLALRMTKLLRRRRSP